MSNLFSGISLSLFCVCIVLFIHVDANLDGCSLYAGGDFTFRSSSLNSKQDSILSYNVATGQLDSTLGSVYKNSPINSLIKYEKKLVFSGNITRVYNDISNGIGNYDFDQKSLFGIEEGLWILGNSLPTSDSESSPTLLFSLWNDKLVVAGHFEHSVSTPSQILHNIALYNATSDKPFQRLGSLLPCNDCSVISLATVDDRIYVVTMDAKSFTTSMYYYSETSSSWTSITQPTSSATMLFNNLLVTENSLFSLGYVSQSRSLSSPSISFYLYRWNLTNLSSGPESVLVYEKSCSTTNNALVYPLIRNYLGNILLGVPLLECPSSASSVNFTVADSQTLQLSPSTIPTLDVGHLKLMEVTTTGDLYVSNGFGVAKILHDRSSWSILYNNQQVFALSYSSLEQRVYISRLSGGLLSVGYFTPTHNGEETIFAGGIYKPGLVLTIAEMANNHIMVGGDFDFVGKDHLISTKLAAIWDGSQWTPTISNSQALPGWRLLSAAAIGNTVYAFADSGPDATFLPLIRWDGSDDDDNWYFLRNLPTIVKTEPYDNTLGTVFIDYKRSDLYFGGQFSVAYDTSKHVTSGVVKFSLEKKEWSALPVNITKVTAINQLSADSYLQIGGNFTVVDKNLVSHTNYLVYDLETGVFLPEIPAVPNTSIILAMALFPGQPQSTFIGGNFGNYGVEQLRHIENTWSFSGVGNVPLTPTVYSLASRNEGTELFAGGSFEHGIARFDIAEQNWSPLLDTNALWDGKIYSLILNCPFDDQYFPYNSLVDDSWYDYLASNCHISLNSTTGYICSPPTLSGWQILGLCFTVFVTLIIVGLIGLFVLKTLKDRKGEEETVEYI